MFLLLWYGFGMANIFSVKQIILETDSVYQITGVVTKVTEKENSVTLQIEKAEVRGDDGLIQTTGVLLIAENSETCIKGDKIMARTRLQMIPASDNPGGFNGSVYYGAQNIFYQGFPEEIILTEACGSLWLRTIFKIRQSLKESYLKIAGEKEAGICISMVLGDKSLLSDELKKLFQDNGIAHILAISGLHVSLLGLTLYQILRRMGTPFWVSAAAGTVLMAAYGIMTGSSVSTMRAVVMFALTVHAQVLGRTYDCLTALFLSAMLIMVRYPYCIYNSGFFLSFGAVLGIVLLSPVLKEILNVRNPVLDSFLVSVAVSLATLPVIMLSYYEIPVYSVFLNLLVVPLMSLLMISAVLAGVAGCFCEGLGVFFMGPATYVIRVYEWLCRIVLQLPAANYITGAPKVWQIALYLGILLLLCVIAACKRKFYKMRVVLIGAALVVLFYRQESGMEVVMLSVGQGDCMYVSCEGYHILIDGGSTTKKELGNYVILPFLKYKGVRSLDYVILTHPDSDHYSGLAELMQSGDIPIQTFVMADVENPPQAYTRMYELASQSAKQVQTVCAGEYIIKDKLTVCCIHPQKSYSYGSVNDSSIVLKWTYGDFDMITTGDVEAEGELNIIKNAMAGDVEVLKCAHHGSSSSSSQAWLEVTRPEITLISCGKNNKYGHPHQETLEKLDEIKSKYYISYETGAVLLHTDGSRIEIRLFKN